jgi:hypothetical protein
MAKAKPGKRRAAKKQATGQPPADARFSPQEQSAIDASLASSHLNPAVVRQAFLSTPIKVGAIELRPLTLATYMLLEEIESPLIEEAGTGVEEFSIRDMAAAVYVLSQPEDAVMASIEKGRPQFKGTVLKWAAKVPAPDLMALGQAVAQQLADAMATVLPTTEKKSPGKPKKSPSAATPETA